MQNQKTQQFAKFFLKDLKIKSPKYNREKNEQDEFNFSSAS
tara:strand:+ start:439 stop:561 length:123 start_codon:yes stop_codon:yes gene_type:complete